MPFLAKPASDGFTLLHTRAGEDRYNFSGPSIARVYNAATSGKDNLGDDREVFLTLKRIAPHIDQAARANLEFSIRATRVVVADLGISQWLNLGCGLPPQSTLEKISLRGWSCDTPKSCRISPRSRLAGCGHVPERGMARMRPPVVAALTIRRLRPP
ncbi:SAM-dependent methyltransferase [Nonomuraea sp. NPDC052265]|uniref:SAM-dependent methyltransferase n=1 Tax=Nonomuraea sp. NPDC052265 TaxID=3364374 RepID=UPI0037C64F47